MGGIGKFLGGLVGGAGSFLSGIKTTLIASAIVGVVAFGSGWYLGSTSSQKIVAHENATVTAGAAAAGAATQAKQNDTDAKVNQADSQKRQDTNSKRDQTAAAIHDSLPTLVPTTAPTVSAEAMDRLNDPALVGETEQ